MAINPGDINGPADWARRAIVAPGLSELAELQGPGPSTRMNHRKSHHSRVPTRSGYNQACETVIQILHSSQIKIHRLTWPLVIPLGDDDRRQLCSVFGSSAKRNLAIYGDVFVLLD